MTKLMHCDHVFDALTRGPFPSGHADDALVEQHLRACHECRTLAEALRPAVGLIHEALAEEASLPVYRGSVHTEALISVADSPRSLGGSAERAEPMPAAPPRRPATSASNGHPASARPGGKQAVVKFLVATAAGVLLCLLWGQFQTPTPVGSSPILTADASFAPEFRSVQSLLDLKLPADCFRPPAPMTEGPTGLVHCCTKCHAAQQSTQPAASKLTAAQLAALSRSCTACHDI